jgi:hypothetical protein
MKERDRIGGPGTMGQEIGSAAGTTGAPIQREDGDAAASAGRPSSDDSAMTTCSQEASIGPAERRLLAAMPLHAITSIHGEAGLRERFAMEIADFGPLHKKRLEEALELAARLHAADRRQREPYLNHLLRVALRLIVHYRVTDADVVCAALLHDAVEDHAAELAPGSGQHEALDVLAEHFGQRVAELVGAVTNPEYEARPDKHEQYRAHMAASLDASPWARVIKASDFTDNGVGLIHTTGPKIGRLAGKYAPLVPVLKELVGRPDTPVPDDVRRLILNQLDRAQQRFAAIDPAPQGSGTPS